MFHIYDLRLGMLQLVQEQKKKKKKGIDSKHPQITWTDNVNFKSLYLYQIMASNQATLPLRCWGKDLRRSWYVRHLHA